MMGRCAQGIRAKASCRKESGDVMAKKNVAAVLVDTLVATFRCKTQAPEPDITRAPAGDF